MLPQLLVGIIRRRKVAGSLHQVSQPFIRLEQPFIQPRHEVLVGLLRVTLVVMGKVVFDRVVADLADKPPVQVGVNRLEQVPHAPLLIEAPHTHFHVGTGEKLQTAKLRRRLAEGVILTKCYRLVKAPHPAEEALGHQDAKPGSPRLGAHREASHGGGEVEQHLVKGHIGDRSRLTGGEVHELALDLLPGVGEKSLRQAHVGI